MSERGLTKRQIERYLAAAKAAGAAGVRFAANGDMIVDLQPSRPHGSATNDDAETLYEEWKKGAARRPDRSQA